VSRDLLITFRFFGSFDESALLERCAGADQGDEVRSVDRPPADLGGFDELEGHRDSGGSRAGSLGDPLPKPHGREGRLDGYLKLSRRSLL
jgi:hypothetical protein